MRRTIKILSLYPKEMNMYGDFGNILTLQKRCEWRGIKTEYATHEIGQEFDTTADIIIGGGGQDSGQKVIQKDLQKNSAALHSLVKDNVPMLVICGMYQMFGHYFETNDGYRIEGIGIFDAHTKAGVSRLTGNITLQTDYGEIIGYENHSGATILNDKQKSFGKVVRGGGNNGNDGSEGAVSNNAIGSYLHGPLLPNNPTLADKLIKLALKNKGLDTTLSKVDDSITNIAKEIASHRPR